MKDFKSMFISLLGSLVFKVLTVSVTSHTSYRWFVKYQTSKLTTSEL